LEHPPVLTLGRNANRSNILASDELLAARGVTLHEINRGGDVTYHGPGQLIGYPIFDLRSLRNPSGHNRLGPVDFVRLMEESLIRLCGELGVAAGRICGLTGVWCGLPEPQISSESAMSAGSRPCDAPTQSAGRKIAAIGIHVSRGVTSHGFAFNVTTDLRDFSLINPCGITDRPVTSLEKETALSGSDLPEAALELEPMARRVSAQFGRVFEQPVEAVESLMALDESLRDVAQRIQETQAQAAPSVGVPLKIPKKIEQLRKLPEQPVRA
jgi:lipoyl(octanoyl) transferase